MYFPETARSLYQGSDLLPQGDTLWEQIIYASYESKRFAAAVFAATALACLTWAVL